VASSVIAYDNGRLFAASDRIYAVNPANGLVLWNVANPVIVSAFYLVATGGLLYETTQAEVLVFSESDGSLLATWSTDYVEGGEAAVTPSGLYVTDYASDSAALDLPGGTVRWHYDPGENSAPATAVFGAGLMWRSNGKELEGASTTSGATAVTIRGDNNFYDALAITSNEAYFNTKQGVLDAASVSSGRVTWTAPLTAASRRPPLVTANAIFDLDDSGDLQVFDRATGQLATSFQLWAPPTNESSPMAVGQGLVVVPDADLLTVFHSPGIALPASAPIATQVPLRVPPPQTGVDTSQSTAFAQSSSHNAVAAGSTITANLHQAWTQQFPGTVSYALIRGDSVYVGAAGGVYRMNRVTGTIVWGPVNIGSTEEVRVTLNDNELFALSADGFVAALSASTGAVLWSEQFNETYPFVGAPTFTDGLLFIHADTYEGGVGIALDAASGSVSYQVAIPVSEGDLAPTVGDNQVFYSGACDEVYATAPASGSINWRFGTCTAGGFGDSTYVRGALYTAGGAIFDPDDGSLIGIFQASNLPVIDDGAMIDLQGTSLRATSLRPDLRRYWSFSGDGTIATDAVVANDLVFVEGTSGCVWALDESTGNVEWTAQAGPANDDINDEDRVLPSVGQDTLLVPDGNTLAAFTSSPT
jgi:outer membrane protein assembly factor BamB